MAIGMRAAGGTWAPERQIQFGGDRNQATYGTRWVLRKPVAKKPAAAAAAPAPNADVLAAPIEAAEALAVSQGGYRRGRLNPYAASATLLGS